MPSLSLVISAANVGNNSGICIEPSSPTSSVCPFSPMSMSQYSAEDLTSGDDSEISSGSPISLNLKFSFEDWHTPFNLNAPCEITLEEDGSQILHIPSSSPFHQLTSQPQLNASFEKQRAPSDCSNPSVCPTLSSKFDLLHSRSPLFATSYGISDVSRAAGVSPMETVMVVDTLDDGFSNGRDAGVHVIRDDDVMEFKAIPAFLGDARLSPMYVF